MRIINDTTRTAKRGGWYGTDGSLDISLYEYGLICKDNDDGTVDVIRGTGIKETDCGDYNFFKFDRWNHYGAEDLPVNESWFDKERFFRFLGMTEDEWKQLPLVIKIYDGISYYGTENILGSSYGGFEIINEDNIQKKED